MNQIKRAFEEIRAEELLKQKTIAYVTSQKTASRANHFSYQGIAACIAMICLFCSGVGFWAVCAEAKSILIEVNPIISLSVNRFDRVIRAEGKNEDAKEVLSGLKLSGMPYRQAVEEIIQQEIDHHYIVDQSAINIEISGGDEEETKRVLGHCARVLEENHTDASIRCNGETHHRQNGGEDAHSAVGQSENKGHHQEGQNGTKGRHEGHHGSEE